MICVVQAGFTYDKIERQVKGWQMTTLDEKRRWAERVGRAWALEGEEDKTEKAWLEWAETDEGWIAAMDGCLLAWK